MTRLTKLFPKSEKVSLLHLAIAISYGYPCFFTTDKSMLKRSKFIKKTFSIDIIDPFASSSGSSFNYYL